MTGAIKQYQELLNNQFGLATISYVLNDTSTYANLKGYVKVEVLEDTVFAELEIKDVLQPDGTTIDTYYNTKTVLAGRVIYGSPTKIILTSGAVRLFRGNGTRDESINPFAFLIDANGSSVCDANGDDIQVKG